MFLHMKTTLRGTQLAITPDLANYLDQKIFRVLKNRFSQFSQENAVTVDIKLSRDSTRHHKGEIFRAEANISIPPRQLLHSEAKAGDIRSAIDFLEETIFRKIQFYKEKSILVVRRNLRKEKERG